MAQAEVTKIRTLATIAAVAAPIALVLAQSTVITNKAALTGNAAIGPNFPLPPFNVGTAIFNTFAASAANLAGIPVAQFSGANSCPTGSNLPQVGYQGGDFFGSSGVAILTPWEVLIPGGNISCGEIHGTVMAIWPSNPGGWGTPSQNRATDVYQWHDMSADINPYTSAAFNASGACAPAMSPGTGADCPQSYNSGIVAGSNYYLVPDAANQTPVFVLIHLTGTSLSAFNFSYQPLSRLSIAYTGSKGWATGIYDGSTWIFFAPTVTNTAWVRHSAAADAAGGNALVSTNWAKFDPKSATCTNGDGFTNVKGGLAAAWDGQRYIYQPPAAGSSIFVRLDTNNFASCTGYTGLDLSKLNTSGHPALGGSVAASAMTGFGGAIAVLTNGDHTSGKLYLYLAPWSQQRSQGANTQSSVAARVQIGHYSAGSLVLDDPTSSAATWEAFDVSTLTANRMWGVNNLGGPTYMASGSCQSVLSGYQLGWVNSRTNTAALNAADALAYLQHDPNHALADPAGWTVTPTPWIPAAACQASAGNSVNKFGGAYDAANNILYPAVVSRTGGNPNSVTLLQVVMGQ